MAPRTFWKGYLKLSLVTCPVTLMPTTTEGEKVRFHTLNADTGNRVVSQYVDSVTEKPVREDDEVKGYQRGEDDYVMLEDAEIEAVALDSTRTIDTVGISRVVMYRRERAVMLKPRGKGIVLWTLRYGDEVRDDDDYFDKLSSNKPEAKLLTLLRKLIDERTTPWDSAMVDDPVQARLLDIIAAKKKGKKRVARAKAPKPETQDNVIDIMAALKKSIQAEGSRRSR